MPATIARIGRPMNEPVWTFRSRLASNATYEEPLLASWEVELSALSDDYSPKDLSAGELLSIWAARAVRRFPDLLVPIYWHIVSPEGGVLEAAPFQPAAFGIVEQFLDVFTWPEGARGNRLNWGALPVIDLRWRPGREDKGGFIQEATGWKPGILQPYVYLPMLMGAAGLACLDR